MESILTSIKKMLGITEKYTHFDEDIIMHINSVFMILTQIGIGPETGFRIEDDLATWEEFTSDNIMLESVKSYMYLKVKSLFDPSASSAVTSSYDRLINELEWRLHVAADKT